MGRTEGGLGRLDLTFGVDFRSGVIGCAASCHGSGLTASRIRSAKPHQFELIIDSSYLAGSTTLQFPDSQVQFPRCLADILGYAN